MPGPFVVNLIGLDIIIVHQNLMAGLFQVIVLPRFDGPDKCAGNQDYEWYGYDDKKIYYFHRPSPYAHL